MSWKDADSDLPMLKQATRNERNGNSAKGQVADAWSLRLFGFGSQTR